MNENADTYLMMIVTGASLRAEEMDRPLAYKISDAIQERLTADSKFRCVVVSDVWYLNQTDVQELPTISVGGPGVNNLSGYLYDRLQSRLAVENVLLIQMDPDLADLRCAVWGMDHETTVEAVDIFIQKGHLEHFLSAVLSRLG